METNDKKLTPQLRFPEFKNSGEWEEDIAKNIFITINDKNHPELSVLAATQEYGMVKRDDINYKIQYNSENTISYKKVSKGDFVIHLRSFQGGFAYSDIEGITSPAYTVFRIKDKSKHYPYFWKHIFTSNQFIKKLELITYGVRDGRSISFKDFSQFKFPTPPLKEQQKIAEFLSSVDELIDNEKIKLENLREYKKGLLQNLFPKENQKVPDLRFPEFKNSGDWEEKQLGIVFDFKNGYTPSKDNSAYWDHGTIPWFRMEDIRLNGNILYDSIQHVTEIAVKGNKLFPANSIILSISATIGEFALIKHDFICNQRFTCLTLQDKCFDIMYCFYYMNIISDWCKYNANNNTFAAVSVEEVKKRYIIFPTLKEQQKIADFLSSVDELIIEQDNKIKLLHDYKKGLLQQLFLQGDLT